MGKKELKTILEEKYGWGNLDASETKWVLEELLDDIADIIKYK